jgi:phage tail sheath gpL-like
MNTIVAAYPFIEVSIDTSQLAPTAQRSPGVIAIVGSTGGSGSAPANTPVRVESLAEAATQFASVVNGAVSSNSLYESIRVALLQDPRPSQIYGVKIGAGGYDPALAALEAADDVTFVSLANVTDVATLAKLKAHVEGMSAAGLKRLAVMMVDPTLAKSPTYASDVHAALTGTPNLKSSVSRVVMVAARGAKDDAGASVDTATAAMAAMAGHTPSTSIVLKRLRGVTIPVADQYSPSEIKALSESGLIPIIQPALIVGGGFHFAEGRLFTTDANLLYIDVVRTLDDIDARLKAGLIGSIGDARITKPGLIGLKTRIDGILGPLKRAGVIDDYSVDIPVLNILSIPDTSLTAAERQIVVDARSNRIVDLCVAITYGPAVHQLRVTLQPKF